MALLGALVSDDASRSCEKKNVLKGAKRYKWRLANHCEMAKSLQTAVVLCLTPVHHDAIVCRRAAKMPSARLEVVGGDDMSVVCAIRLEVAGRWRVRIGRLNHSCRVTVVSWHR